MMNKLNITLWFMLFSFGQAYACEFDQVTFDSNFAGGRLDECRQLGDNRYELTLKPENTPINDSPWYAYKITAKTPQTITVITKIKGFKHRYPPKISRNGVDWQLQKYVIDNQRMRFSVAVDDKPTWIAAQEIILSEHYHQWGKQLAQAKSINHDIVGWSVQKRPLFKIEHVGEGHEWLVILGSMHPPEVTGAKAIFPFVETLLADGKLAKRFRQRFNISRDRATCCFN